jgi:hypothetical protein
MTKEPGSLTGARRFFLLPCVQTGSVELGLANFGTFSRRHLRVTFIYISFICVLVDRLYGLVLRVHGYRSRGPEFDSRRYRIFSVVGPERVSLSLCRITEELLE